MYDLQEDSPIGTTYGVYACYAMEAERDALIKFAEAFQDQFLTDHPNGRFEIIKKTSVDAEQNALFPGAVYPRWALGTVAVKWTVNPVRETMGGRVKQIREERGMSQQQLASAVGVKQETINHWEAETRQIKAGDLLRLCAALQVSADWILGLREGE